MTTLVPLNDSSLRWRASVYSLDPYAGHWFIWAVELADWSDIALAGRFFFEHFEWSLYQLQVLDEVKKTLSETVLYKLVGTFSMKDLQHSTPDLTFLKEIAERISKDYPKGREEKKTKRTKRKKLRKGRSKRTRVLGNPWRRPRTENGFHSRLYSCDESCEAENILWWPERQGWASPEPPLEKNLPPTGPRKAYKGLVRQGDLFHWTMVENQLTTPPSPCHNIQLSLRDQAFANNLVTWGCLGTTANWC